jgi:TIR domain
MPDLFLFVSHVIEDRLAALEIVAELERRGVPCWITPRDVRPGKPFDDEIAEAIEASRAMLLIFSDRCNDREYIRREVTVAGESHKVIIPFRIEDAQPRRGLRVRLSDLHWIDGFVSREQAIDQVVRTITPNQAHQQEEDRKAEQQRHAEEAHKAEDNPIQLAQNANEIHRLSRISREQRTQAARKAKRSPAPSSDESVPMLVIVSVQSPGQDVPSHFAQFVGKWGGYWGGILASNLVVTSMTPSGAFRAVYAWGTTDQIPVAGSVNVMGRVTGAKLSWGDPYRDVGLMFTLQPDGTLHGEYWNHGVQRGSVIMKKISSRLR